MSCEASSTFQVRSVENEHFVWSFLDYKLPNEHFVRGIFNFSGKKRRKRAFRARLPSNSTLSTWKLTISCEFFITPFLQSSKSMTFAKLPPLSKTLTKCCACHDIFEVVSSLRVPDTAICRKSPSPRHKMLRLPRHRERPHHKLCCASQEKMTHLHWHVSKSRKTRKRPPIFCLGSAKTSISCETSSTFHTLKERIVSQCVYRPMERNSWRSDDDTTTTRPTRREHRSNPRTPTINGNPSLRIREKKGFSIINHPFWGTSIFGNTHMYSIYWFSLWKFSPTHFFRSKMLRASLR